MEFFCFDLVGVLGWFWQKGKKILYFWQDKNKKIRKLPKFTNTIIYQIFITSQIINCTIWQSA